MTVGKLTKKDLRFKALLLSGLSIPSVAKTMKIPRNTAYSIRNRLLSLGEIMADDLSKSPVHYIDPHSNQLNPPTGDYPAENGTYEPPIENYGGSEIPKLDLTNVSTSPDCPDGYTSTHLCGWVKFVVRKKGTFDDVKSADRRTYVGHWYSKPTSHKGSTYWKLEVRLFNQIIGVQYREGNRGAITFMLYPGRIYVNADAVKHVNDYNTLFLDRARYVTALLSRTGWQLTDPVIKGVIHHALPEGHPLMALIPRDHVDDNDDIIVDTSLKVPEVEMEHCDDIDKIKIFANMPSAIKELQQSLSATMSILAQLVDVQKEQTKIIVTNVDNSSRMVQTDTNLISCVASNQAQMVGTFRRNLDGTHADDGPKEGYQ